MRTSSHEEAPENKAEMALIPSMLVRPDTPGETNGNKKSAGEPALCRLRNCSIS
jgi:hypothetical protein